MFKKRIFIFTTLVLLILFIAACGQVNNVTPQNSDIGVIDNTNLPKNNPEVNTQIESTKLHTVKGTSEGVMPYASVDWNNAVSRIVGKEGGVLEANLANDVKMYVIIPEGNVLSAASATVSILPYKEMPTGEKHFALSDQFGYGAEVIIDSMQLGIKAYVVFDTTGGKAAENIQKSKIIRNRCDPSKTWFNPIICARQNKVPAEKLIDKEYAVVSPIYSQGHEELILPRNTIPLGSEGLIAAEVSKGDVFIPQKLDKGLAYEFVKQIGKYGNSAENIQAALFALEWGLPIGVKQADGLIDSINGVEPSSAVKKGVMVAPKISIYASAQALATATYDDSSSEEWATVSGDLKESADSRAGAFYDEVEADNQQLGSGIAATEGAAVLGDLSDSGVNGASDSAQNVGENIQNNVETDGSNPSSASDVVNAGEAAQNVGRPKIIDIQKGLQDAIENTLNNPQSSIGDLLDAAALAQKLGLDDLADKILDKVKKKIEDQSKNLNLSKNGLYNLAGIAQAVGLDDLANSLLDRAAKAKDEACDTLVKKNLKNFGMNACK